MKRIILVLLGMFILVGFSYAKPIDKALDVSIEWVKEKDVLKGDIEIPGECQRNYVKGDIRMKYFGSPEIHYIEIVDRKEHEIQRFEGTYQECMIIFNLILSCINPVMENETYILFDKVVEQ